VNVVICGPIGLGIAVDYVGRGKLAAVATRIAGRTRPLSRQIRGEDLVQALSEAAQASDIVRVDLSAAVGWQVEEERCAAPHRVEVEIDEVFGRAHFVVLGGVVEPAGADRHITFSGEPGVAVTVTPVEEIHW
jgi:hypothetical protein